MLCVAIKYGGPFFKQGEKGAQGPPGNMGHQGRPVSTYYYYYNLQSGYTSSPEQMTNSAFCCI